LQCHRHPHLVTVDLHPRRQPQITARRPDEHLILATLHHPPIHPGIPVRQILPPDRHRHPLALPGHQLHHRETSQHPRRPHHRGRSPHPRRPRHRRTLQPRIHLHHPPAGPRTGIGDRHLHHPPRTPLRHRQPVVVERGVGQPVPERITHRHLPRVVPPIA